MTHKHKRDDWEGYKPVDCIEIGANCCLQKLGRVGKPNGYISGFIIAHDVAGHEYRCEGVVNVDPELTKDKFWTMTGTIEDGNLTLSPSILCQTHSEFHAFITNGKWTG
jgi:hypothetical protein